MQQAFDRQLANVLEDRALDLDSEIELLERTVRTETMYTQTGELHMSRRDRGDAWRRRQGGVAADGDRPRRRRLAAAAGAPPARRPPAAGPLAPADMARVAEIAGSVDVTDAQGISATACRRRAASPTSPTRCSATCATRTPAPAARRCSDLLKKVRELDVDALSAGSGKAQHPDRRRASPTPSTASPTRYQKVATSIDRIVDALERSRMALLKDMTVLDKMFELNLEYLKQLDVYIAAGEQVARASCTR